MLYRNIFTVSFLILIFFLPWWLITLAILLGFILFDFYLEGSGLIFLIDLLYSPPLAGFFTVQFLLTIISLILLLIIEYSKRNLIVYNS